MNKKVIIKRVRIPFCTIKITTKNITNSKNGFKDRERQYGNKALDTYNKNRE